MDRRRVGDDIYVFVEEVAFVFTQLFEVTRSLYEGKRDDDDTIDGSKGKTLSKR